MSSNESCTAPCNELHGLKVAPPPPIPHEVEPSAAARAESLTEQAIAE